MEKVLLIEKATLRAPRKLDESKGGGDGKWTAEVWRLDELNDNGHNYTTELANKVISWNLTTTCNDGHNADFREEYACAKAIANNPRIESGLMVVDVEFIDKEYEGKLSLLADKGVPIGCSSVGYGEMDENGRIVPETYELVRYLDFVTCPAGGVYAKKKESKAEDKTHNKPSVEDEKRPAMAESVVRSATKIYLKGVCK